MKKKKMSLGKLKVESFVTQNGGMNSETVKGGATAGCVAVSLQVVCVSAVGCFPTIQNCVTRDNNCFSVVGCQSRLICPSLVDGCPSALGCTIDTIGTIQTPGGGF